MVNGCSDAVAEAYRSLALALFGTSSRDKIQLAEMSVASSIHDIVQAENKSTRELSTLVARVRELNPQRNRGQVLELLSRTRVLRATLACLAKKRTGMEQSLEALRQSQLNQNMLLSMRHTSDALQTVGLKVGDADHIMLDMEESASDLNAMQNVLSTSFADDLSQEDLDAELELVLSDDALCPLAIRKRLDTAAAAFQKESPSLVEPAAQPAPAAQSAPAAQPAPAAPPEAVPPAQEEQQESTSVEQESTSLK
jgi:hypothetical protein